MGKILRGPSLNHKRQPRTATLPPPTPGTKFPSPPGRHQRGPLPFRKLHPTPNPRPPLPHHTPRNRHPSRPHSNPHRGLHPQPRPPSVENLQQIPHPCPRLPLQHKHPRLHPAAPAPLPSGHKRSIPLALRPPAPRRRRPRDLPLPFSRLRRRRRLHELNLQRPTESVGKLYLRLQLRGPRCRSSGVYTPAERDVESGGV